MRKLIIVCVFALAIAACEAPIQYYEKATVACKDGLTYTGKVQRFEHKYRIFEKDRTVIVHFDNCHVL